MFLCDFVCHFEISNLVEDLYTAYQDQDDRYVIAISETHHTLDEYEIAVKRHDFELICSAAGTMEINAFENGPVLAVLLKMAVETEDLDR